MSFFGIDQGAQLAFGNLRGQVGDRQQSLQLGPGATAAYARSSRFAVLGDFSFRQAGVVVQSQRDSQITAVEIESHSPKRVAFFGRFIGAVFFLCASNIFFVGVQGGLMSAWVMGISTP